MKVRIHKVVVSGVIEEEAPAPPRPRPGLYKLLGHTPVPATIEEVARMTGEDCRVACDEVRGLVVSTVFLRFDHNHFRDGPPLLFETMIFKKHGGVMDWSGTEYQERVATWDEAVREHAKALAFVHSL